jgi:carboxyl-terminal processing protease
LNRLTAKTPAEIFEKYKRQGSGFVGREASGIVRAARAELAGDTSTKPRVDIRDSNELKRTVNLTRKKANPARQLNFESKRIGDNIAYVRFNLFIGELAQKFSEALITHKDSKALIVDIRGNGGGIGDLATTLASMLTSSDGTLGESRFRYETRQFSYVGSKNAYQGKVIFLVDGFSASTSEVISGGLQHAKRITVLGEQTTGAVLPSLMTVLPTGGAMQYAISDFRLPNQRVLEGEGVIPDETIKFNRRDVIAGRDPVLARALALLAN